MNEENNQILTQKIIINEEVNNLNIEKHNQLKYDEESEKLEIEKDEDNVKSIKIENKIGINENKQKISFAESNEIKSHKKSILSPKMKKNPRNTSFSSIKFSLKPLKLKNFDYIKFFLYFFLLYVMEYFYCSNYFLLIPKIID